MILVHPVEGGAIFLNSDLIECIEATPGTVITLADGRRLFVADPPTELVRRITAFRAGILTVADELRAEGREASGLHLLPNVDTDHGEHRAPG